MKIQRENDFDKVSFSFRVRASLKKFYVLKEYLDLNCRYSFKIKNNQAIVIVDLEEIDNSDIIIYMIDKYKLKSRSYDLYFDIISSYDFGGVEMPKGIIDIIKRLDCNIHFSYVVC
jgi:hypothetical protein